MRTEILKIDDLEFVVKYTMLTGVVIHAVYLNGDCRDISPVLCSYANQKLIDQIIDIECDNDDS